MLGIKKFSREELSWICYDVANSAFVLVIITAIMPIFFKEYSSRGVDSAISTSNWAFANSLASLLLAILAPILGAYADYQGQKKKFFLFFLFLGLIATFSLTSVREGGWLLCLIIFAVGRIGFAGANLFYDAFLPDITPRERMDWVSASGYAWGYIGSVAPFLLVMVLIFKGMQASGSTAIPPLHAKIGFVTIGLWWLIFSLPMLKNVHQRYYVAMPDHPVQHSFKRLLATFREIRRYKQAVLFLIAYFLYIDGVDTIITMATAYGLEIGLSATMLMLAILMIQVVAFPFALFYGACANRFNTKAMLLTGIAMYAVITFIAFLLPFLPTIKMKTLVFWLLAFLVATSMGGIQALSRSFFGKLIPPERSAEFFGFYNIFGKFAVITGPFLIGVIGRLTGHTQYGILSIFLLFLAGGLLLIKVRPEEIR